MSYERLGKNRVTSNGVPGDTDIITSTEPQGPIDKDIRGCQCHSGLTGQSELLTTRRKRQGSGARMRVEIGNFGRQTPTPPPRLLGVYDDPTPAYNPIFRYLRGKEGL